MMMDRPLPTLDSERFTLRPLVADDAHALFSTLSDEDSCLYLTRAPFAEIEELTAWLCDPDWPGLSWSAVEKASGELVARLVAVPISKGIAEIGYITVKHRAGEGIASECLARLIAHLFKDAQLDRVIAETDPRNAASNAILRKLGFHLDEHRKQSVETHIGWCDEYLWSMDRSAWSAD